MLQTQSLSPPIRRMDSLRYATSAVGALFTKGRKRWSVIVLSVRTTASAFMNSYPGVCGRRREGQMCVRATTPPSSPHCLSATTPPPWAGDSRGPLSGAGGRTTYTAALALDCTRRRRCCMVICNKYIAVTYVKFREISQYCRENKSRESIAGKRYTIDALVAAQPLSRGGGRRQLVRHGG